jgi:hypothetical protein
MRQAPIERQVEARAPALEVLVQLPAHAVEEGRHLEHPTRYSFAQLFDHAVPIHGASECDSDQAAVRGSDEHHADGRLDGRVCDVYQPVSRRPVGELAGHLLGLRLVSGPLSQCSFQIVHDFHAPRSFFSPS